MGSGPCEKAGDWAEGRSNAEVDWEMKATSVLFVLLATAMVAVVAAQPVLPAARLLPPGHLVEPVWMLLSGATLLAVASAVRRYLP